jgi:hypothetical protein
MPMFKSYDVKTTVQGRTYNAGYELDGGKVRVSSAYGSKSAAAGKDARATAERLLEEIVRQRH